MKFALIAFTLLILFTLASLHVWRLLDLRADQSEITRLLGGHRSAPPAFSREMVAALPAPAKRYFEFVIQEGTPLNTVADITMHGEFGIGDKSAPNYLPMEAREVLAYPEGFIWQMSGGTGIMRISGADSKSWTRFWLAGLVPVARDGGTQDHTRSAFGRYASEAVFWTPAALLPGPGIHWQEIDANTARVTLSHAEQTVSVDVRVDLDGRPIEVSLRRWSNANSTGVYQDQPFGGYLSEFREFDGFRLPTRIEAGNFFGTEAYFPFIKAEIADIRFKGSTDAD